MAADRLFDNALHCARIIGGDQLVGRSHYGRVTGVIDECRNRLASGPSELNHLYLAIAGAFRIYTEEPFARCRDRAPIAVDILSAAPNTNADWPQLRDRFARGLAGQCRNLRKPWIHQVIAFFDPALVRHRTGMRVRGSSSNIGYRNSNCPTDRATNLIG